MQDFFRRVLPSTGPFTLFAGPTGADGKLYEPRHWNGFTTHEALAAQVQKLSMQPLNIFFAVGNYAGSNRKEPISKRALYIDLDAKDFGSISDAIKQLGIFVRSVGLPPPSIYVNSGRGVHVYWCLDRDVPVSEWQPVADALKAKCIELEFTADPTSTADPARILRAPGSLNRKEQFPIACNVMADNGTSYDIASIAAQLHVNITLSAATTQLATTVSNNDLVTQREYEQITPAEVRDMLNHVNLPKFAARDMWINIMNSVQDWSDKSQLGFDIIHDWSANQPGYVDEADVWKTWDSFTPGGGIGIGTLIKLARENGYGALGTPEPVPLPPNASLAEQMEAAAAAQEQTGIEDTNADAAPVIQNISPVSPLLIAASHAVKATGKPRFEHNVAVHWLANEFVMILDQDAIYYSLTQRQPMSKTSIDDLLTRYMPLNSSGVPITASTLMRRFGVVNIVSSQGFYPGMPQIFVENGKLFVNLYTDPPALIKATPAEAALFADLMDYVFPREEDKEFGRYILQFFAHIVQKPHIKIASAPLMLSSEFGTGKTTMMYDIPKALVGNSNARMVSNKVLRSNFSDYIEGAHFLHFDEVHINGKWDSDDTANAMKTLITGADVEVHPKGGKPYNIPNRIFITATSNYNDAVSLPADDERRWGIYYLRPMRGYTKEQAKRYFGIIHQWLESPRGPGALRYILSHVDISKFNPKDAPPLTIAKLNMVEKSQSSEVQIIIEAIREGDGPFKKDLLTIEEIRQYLSSETGKKYSSNITRGMMQRAAPSAIVCLQTRLNGERVRPWIVRNQDKWRDATADELRDALKN